MSLSASASIGAIEALVDCPVHSFSAIQRRSCRSVDGGRETFLRHARSLLSLTLQRGNAAITLLGQQQLHVRQRYAAYTTRHTAYAQRVQRAMRRVVER